jgi:hypothetical protein
MSTISLVEFEAIFESVKNWGRWGPNDDLGTLSHVTPAKVREAAGLIRTGRRASMAIPIDTVAGPDNAQPATLALLQGHDVLAGLHIDASVGALERLALILSAATDLKSSRSCIEVATPQADLCRIHEEPRG